jgi:probable F420-dependent oxidoreductase
MKFGLMFANAGPGADPEFSTELAQLAEGVGFESLWTVEHVVVPKGHESSYPYSKDGKMPGGESVPVPDPLIWLTWAAAATRTINLATGIVILPQRNPLILAKECATLDRLSKGRLQLGIGVGWLREEFDALGVPWEARGARTDDYVGALRELWTSAEPTYSGPFTSFTSAFSEPKPFGGRSIPIHVGGHSKAAAARAGRIGDGFFPGTAKELPSLVTIMRAAAVEAGRNPDAIEITGGGAPTVDGVTAAQDLGIARFVVSPMGADMETIRTRLGQFSDQVISKFA